MLITRPALALVAALCLAPLAGAAPAQSAPAQSAPADTAQRSPDAAATDDSDAKPTGDTPPAAAPAEAEEDKRICRYVKLETASRRKTKVCRTLEGWRELNNPR